jgi:hypothetical protein
MRDCFHVVTAPFLAYRLQDIYDTKLWEPIDPELISDPSLPPDPDRSSFQKRENSPDFARLFGF